MKAHPKPHNSARFWSAPALWRFARCESGRGLPQSKTLLRMTGDVYERCH
jgi:hypothetical protein